MSELNRDAVSSELTLSVIAWRDHECKLVILESEIRHINYIMDGGECDVIMRDELMRDRDELQRDHDQLLSESHAVWDRFVKASNAALDFTPKG